MSNIVGLKLMSGIEVAGNLESGLESGPIVLSKTRIVHASYTQQGVQLAMPMPPFTVMRVDKPIEFARDSIAVIIDELDGEIERAYLQSTTSIDLTGMK